MLKSGLGLRAGAHHNLLPILLGDVRRRYDGLPRFLGELILADALAAAGGGPHGEALPAPDQEKIGSWFK